MPDKLLVKCNVAVKINTGRTGIRRKDNFFRSNLFILLTRQQNMMKTGGIEMEKKVNKINKIYQGN